MSLREALRPARASGAAERLDAPTAHDPEMLETSLAHVAAVNRWLGGWRSVLLHLPEFLPAEGPARVLDVGTGSGEAALVAAQWARRNGRELRITATDANAAMVQIAARHTADYPEIRVEPADALALPYPDGAFHVAMLTLTLHHFEGDAAVRVLRELARVARGGIVVSDLERRWSNYLGAKLLSWTLWARNPLTRHDGPLSVLRSYTRDELLSLARAAGLEDARVRRHRFQRLVLTASGTVTRLNPPQPSSAPRP